MPLGPFLLRFPSRIGPDQLPWLQRFFEMLPREHRYLLELRHPAFFPRSDALEDLAGKFALGAVTLDSHALHAGPAHHPEVAGALHEKPNLPVSPSVRANLACVRLVLHPDWREPQRGLPRGQRRHVAYRSTEGCGSPHCGRWVPAGPY